MCDLSRVLHVRHDIIYLLNKISVVFTVKYVQRIKDLREDKDMKQADVAQILKTARNYYGEYERGTRPLPINHLITLCRFYDVSADYILGFTNEKKSLPK